MGGRILEKKKRKMTKLYDSAYELFTSKGVHQTVVDDIVKRAGIAKGTFYLYCKDKYDLVDKIIIRKASAVLNNAMNALSEEKKREQMNFQQSVIYFVDYLVNFFKSDTRFLELIFKNLSLSLYEQTFSCKEMEDARKAFTTNFMLQGQTRETAGKRLYLIVCIVGVVCYNSIVQKIPYEFDEIKPELYRAVRRILS
jgi:AcrR family transcriptional regulator